MARFVLDKKGKRVLSIRVFFVVQPISVSIAEKDHAFFPAMSLCNKKQ